MKKIFLYTLIIACSALTISCQPDEFPAIGERLSRTEGIKGNWKVESVVQIDEIAKSKGDTDFELDVTDLFNLESYSVTFEEGNPGTFTVTANGAPNFVDAAGTWSFDDETFPTKVLLFADGATEATSEFTLARVPAEGFNLQVKFQRFDGDKLFLSYLYTFSRVTN